MQPLKGLILSGGAGSRMRPITHTSAKQLVPVANRPILFYVLDDLAGAGIDEIGIIVGDTAGDADPPGQGARSPALRRGRRRPRRHRPPPGGEARRPALRPRTGRRL